MLMSNRTVQSRFLSQAIQLEELVNPFLLRITVVIITLSIIAFLVWSAVTNVHEVARTAGEIVPQGLPRVVQSLEGGIVKSLSVQEGDTVKAGQILMLLNGTGAAEDLSRAKAKQASFALQEERLRAFLESRKPVFTRFAKQQPDVIKDQMSFYQDMQATQKDEMHILTQQISQKKRGLSSLQADLLVAEQNFDIAKTVMNRRLLLNKEGYTSSIQLLETQQNVNKLQGDMSQIKQRIAATKDEIIEFEGRYSHITTEAKSQAGERLDSLLAEKAQNEEIIDKLNSRVSRLLIRAPVAGRIQGLSINTVGEVITSGQTIMEIVPVDQKLLVQVKIPPKDIGHIEKGQKVHVKISSFDFSRYGIVEGDLVQVSATTFTGTQGERYYQGIINLDRLYVGNNPNARITPGMTVMADIITGKKTVLQYLLKPINNALKTAFTER